MKVDPAVTRMKYDCEIARLTEQRGLLEQRGIFLLGSSTFPSIDLVFVPRHSLAAGVLVTRQGSLFLPGAVRMQMDVPSISGSAFKAHFDLSNYDLDAPSLEFRDAWTDVPLQYATMFKAIQFDQHRKGHLVLLDAHPTTQRPFLCMRGIREYHEHPQHSGDEWLLYRESMNMFSIIMSLWRVAIDLVRPIFIVQEDGGQVQWVGQEKL